MINLLDSTNMKKIQLYLIICFGIFQTAWSQQDLKRANDLFTKAHYADAISLYEAALPYNKNSEVIKNLADSYYHTFDLKAAARWYRYLISNYGDKVNEQYYFKLSQSLKAIGEYEKAHKDFEKSITIDTSSTSAYYYRHKIYEKQDLIEKQKADLLKTIKMDPNDPEGYYLSLIHISEPRD